MGLIKFDFLFAEVISENNNEIKYVCTMDKNYSNDSHTFTIIKSAFENVYENKDDLAQYVFNCMENNLIKIDGITFSRDIPLIEIGLDRIAAARYIFASYLQENEIPKNIGIISPKIKQIIDKKIINNLN